jgi:hypothetical protein
MYTFRKAQGSPSLPSGLNVPVPALRTRRCLPDPVCVTERTDGANRRMFDPQNRRNGIRYRGRNGDVRLRRMKGPELGATDPVWFMVIN